MTSPLARVSAPRDAIEVDDWEGFAFPDLRIRQFITHRQTTYGELGELTVTLGGGQSFHLEGDPSTDVRTERYPYATVIVSVSRHDGGGFADLSESQLRNAAAAFIAAADRLAAQ